MAIKNTTKDSIYAQVVEGKTTQADVQQTYGVPTAKTFTDGGNEIWTYDYAYATAKGINFVPIVGLFTGGADVEKKQLVVMFDKDGVVSRRVFSESQQEIRRGVGSGQ
jgi:outer membrane protein assembly factor BamE (lipoprotein component of BamABCDE complex)